MARTMSSRTASRAPDLTTLVKAYRKLSKDLEILAGSLNTAPVTLAALAKESRTVNSVLNRFKLFCSTYPSALQNETGVLDDIYNGPVKDLVIGLADLQVAVDRLRRDEEEGDSHLIIVWSEGSLKQTLKQLSATRSSLEFLINCAASQLEAIQVTRPATSTTCTTATLIDPDAQCLSPVAVTPHSGVFRVSDLPGVRSALEELRPEPGIVYTPSAKLSTRLHEAIEQRDNELVLSLLLQRVDPNAPRPGTNVSPLDRAFEQKSSSIATFLAIAGADLNSQRTGRESALLKGVKLAFPDKFIALLCELGACIDATDTTGSSALHYAAASKEEDDTLATLVHAGADINLRDKAGRTPLMVAVEKGRLRSVEVLTEYEADMEARTPTGGTALHIAVTKRHYMMVEILTDRGARIDTRLKGHTALTLAITTASPEIAALLIEAGADVNMAGANRTTPLLAAATIGDAQITEQLLAQDARLDIANEQGYYPVHMAVHKNKVEILQLLIGAGSPVDSATQQNETPISIAVEFGYPQIVQHLIQAGVNLDEPPPGRQRVIHAAIKSRNAEICLRLIHGGADCSTPFDKAGTSTPIHLAAELGLDTVVTAMIAAGANFESTTWQGFTPLFAAAENGQLSTVRLLLKHGASIRARSTSGGNLLFYTTSHPVILKSLIELNIDVNERDHYGASALHYAALWGHAAGAKMLLQKGAKLKHANSVFETMADFREGTPYRQGTPAGLAKQKGHIQLAKLIDKWKVKS